MATFALKSLFKINLRNRGNVLLAGAQLRAWTTDTHQHYIFSLGVRNIFSCISPPSTWVGCAADRAAELSCLSRSFFPFGEDVEEADIAAKPFCSLCAQHKSHSLGKPPQKGATRTQSHPALFFLYFFIESFIKENRSLNLTSTDLQKAPGVGKWQLFRIVLQMENIKKNHSSTDLSETFWDISTQMPI